jgi:hypothetical protein
MDGFDQASKKGNPLVISAPAVFRKVAWQTATDLEVPATRIEIESQMKKPGLLYSWHLCNKM